ncbi:hypothetical protein NIES2100_06980 [Calothrix sp. NIES-2100]|nr:hypothetical protein NIES2100_06980 [Calothrix sp. NIES-2100]
MVNVSGYELFSISENFLTDLSDEDESIITGGGGCSHGRSKSKSRKHKRSKSRSKSRKYCR